MASNSWTEIEDLFVRGLSASESERRQLLRDVPDPHVVAAVERLWVDSAEAPPGFLRDQLEPETMKSYKTDDIVVGRFRLDKMLGTGGMGQVFGAFDMQLERPVALKVLSPRLVKHPITRGLLEREARAVCCLAGHPNICTVYEFCVDGETPFLVMEFLAGETLAARLRRGTLPVSDAVAIGLSVIDGLAHAHSQNVVHRDLKPGNVMLTPFGPKLFDFGIAKRLESPGLGEVRTLAAPGAFVGSVSYASPEQVEGLSIDSRSDIFSVGCVLYEMVTGVKAFDGANVFATALAVVRSEPREIRDINPAVPFEYVRIVTMCLQKTPSQRFQRTAELRDALDRLAQSVVDAKPPTAGRFPQVGARTSPLEAAALLRQSDSFRREAPSLQAPKERASPHPREASTTAIASFSRDAPVSIALGALYGTVLGLTLLVEVAYRWDQFSDWVLGAAVTIGLTSALVATSIFELMRRRIVFGRPHCLAIATALFCAWSALVALSVAWRLPTVPLIDTTIQAMPARVGWVKGVLEALVVPTLSLLPLHAVFVLRRAFATRSTWVPPGLIVPEPGATAIVFAVVAIVWIGANKGFIESVKTGPYSALYMSLLIIRAAVGLLTLLGVVLWYTRRYSELKLWASEA